MAEHEVSSEVPPQLRKLVRLVTRAFYQPEHYVVMDILATYPCVKESDLIELLKIEGKKLRMVLAFLKKDKMIKCIQKMESEENEAGEKRNCLCYYYYINYKVFVNVVKYKLDQIRKKIEAEERKTRNRMAYVCPECKKNFSDLDVDWLMDPVEGVLRCDYCETQLQEDIPEGEVTDARSMLSRLNQQLCPVLDLLRQTENLNLAPELLDPEPHGIGDRIRQIKIRSGIIKPGKAEWTISKTVDLYGDQSVSVNIGAEGQMEQKAVAKEIPQWILESTIDKEGANGREMMEEGAEITGGAAGVRKSLGASNQQILADLLVHEAKHSATASTAAIGQESSSSSGGDSGSDEEPSIEPSWQQTFQSSEEDGDSDDEFTIKLGDRVVALNDVTDDMVKQMNSEERERYQQLYQQAYSDLY